MRKGDAYRPQHVVGADVGFKGGAGRASELAARRDSRHRAASRGRSRDASVSSGSSRDKRLIPTST